MPSEVRCDACGAEATWDNPVGVWSDGIQTCKWCDEIDAEVQALLENGPKVEFAADGRWHARATENGKLVFR